MDTFWQDARERAGLTQAQVSKKLGYSTPQFVSNWERGLCSPPAKQLVKISSMYKLTQSEVIDYILQQQRKKILSVFRR